MIIFIIESLLFVKYVSKSSKFVSNDSKIKSISWYQTLRYSVIIFLSSIMNSCVCSYIFFSWSYEKRISALNCMQMFHHNQTFHLTLCIWYLKLLHLFHPPDTTYMPPIGESILWYFNPCNPFLVDKIRLNYTYHSYKWKHFKSPPSELIHGTWTQ